MARRSRADMEREKLLEEQDTPKSKLYSTVIYARLSTENSCRGKDKHVMETQIQFCKNFIENATDLKLNNIYFDDGATGTNFNRSGFKNLIEDIEKGIIDCIVVRDFSRLGRNRIECLRYLTTYFPEKKVRFIAISDYYDSLTCDESSLDVLIKNIINDFYSKDISRKMTIVNQKQMKDGTYKLRNTPYGYKYSENKEDLLIDEPTAEVVRNIFRWKVEEINSGVKLPRGEMINRLNSQNAPTPKRRNGNSECISHTNQKWGIKMVQYILGNPLYTGDLVLGKSETALYLGIKYHILEEEKWKVFPNHHPALVNREDFEKVKQALVEEEKERVERKKRNKKSLEQLQNLFQDKFFCADCGGKMYYLRNKTKDSAIRYGSYFCGSSRKDIHCARHYIKQVDLEEIVLDAIKTQIQLAFDSEKILAMLKNSTRLKAVRDKYNMRIKQLTFSLNSLKRKNSALYRDYVKKILSEEEYLYAKKSFQEDLEQLDKLLADEMEKSRLFQESMSTDNKWITLVKSISRTRKLNQSLVDMAIAKVLIHEDGTVELLMKYHDIFLDMKAGIDEVEREEVC